jgi:hypothetical protein
VSQVQQSMQRNGAASGQAFSRGTNQNGVARPTPGVRTPSGGFNSAAGAQSADRGAGGNANVNNDHTGRPSASDGSGWRRFSGSNAAQPNGGMNRSSGMSSGAASNVPRPGNSVGAGASTNSNIAQPYGGMNRSSGMSSGGASNVPRPGNSAGAGASNNDGGWRRFTPQSGGNVQSSPDRVGGGMNGSGMNGGGGMNGRTSNYPSRNEMSRPQMDQGGGRGMAQDSSRGYSRPPLEMRQPIVTPRSTEVRGSAPRESAPSRPSGGGGGGGNHGGSGGGHGGGGGPHGGSGRR